jgi:glycosyltransferase involved in cell wall biosynthesis
MTNAGAAISVAIPVYNGAAFLAEAVESVLRQSRTDFEIILLDNASTDDTASIGRRYAEADPRVKYHRNDTTVSPEVNFVRALDLCRGDAFMWLAHDDLLVDQDYLETLAATLDQGYDFAFAETARVHEDGTVLPGGMLAPFHNPAADRIENCVSFVRIYSTTLIGTHFYGLYRRSVVTSLQQYYLTDGGDELICSEGIFLNRVFSDYRAKFVPEVRFGYRFHDNSYSSGARIGSQRLLAGFDKYVRKSLAIFRTSSLPPAGKRKARTALVRYSARRYLRLKAGSLARRLLGKGKRAA